MDKAKLSDLEKGVRDVSRHLYFFLKDSYGEKKSKLIVQKVLIKISEEYKPLEGTGDTVDRKKGRQTKGTTKDNRKSK